MTEKQYRAGKPLLMALAVAALLGGCTFSPWDMSSSPYAGAPTTQTAANPVPAGSYRVNPGDTLAGIAAAFGQRTQDLASWNGLPVNAAVSPGQVLRVTPAIASQGATQAAMAGATPPAVAAMPPPAAPAATVAQQGVLAWPLRGPVLRTFAPGKSNGIVIGGRPGDPVRAAATGRVVYAGTGIEAYGPLIIIKHDESLITAYGQNSELLVKEGDAVVQGQTIGEVGEDSHGVGSVLFEVRKDGHPVDPLAWLPKPGG